MRKSLKTTERFSVTRTLAMAIPLLVVAAMAVKFTEVPFNAPTVEYRLRAVWGGILGCVAEDENGQRIRSAVEACPNVLGVFAAHAHFRSEDQLGQTCQFMAPPGHDGQWRHVKIGASTPPKSLRPPGQPSVENLDL